MNRAVEEADVGDRLDVALARWLGETRSRVVARIESGEVDVDGHPALKRHLLRAGEIVTVRQPAPAPVASAPPMPPVRFEDEHLLVIAKPARLVVHAGAGHRGDTLVDAMLAAGVPLAVAAGEDRPGIVHRLDRDTSGLLVVAKTDQAYEALTGALRERRVSRGYLTLVRGEPTAARGRIDAPIGRDPGHRTRYAVTTGGKPAVTRYRVLESATAPTDPPRTVALLACRLETGRTHQIRVHLAGLGHGVVGDGVYGVTGSLAASLGLQRPFLHAAELEFAHPVTGEPVAFAEPLPDDLRAASAVAGLAEPRGGLFDAR